MKILLVVCRQSRMRSYQMPLGIGYVSASLKSAGHDVAVLNPNHSSENLETLLINALAHHQPQLVGLGGMSFHLEQIKKIAAVVRQQSPSSKIMIGGPLVSFQPEVAITAIPEADYGVRGEGEHTAVELATALETGVIPSRVKGLIYREPGSRDRLRRTESRPPEDNLDALPWPDHEGMGLDTYAGLHRPGEGVPALIVNDRTRLMPLLTSRGCPNACTFCCHGSNGRRYRQRSLDHVFAEINFAVERFGINAISIYDDLFSFGRTRLEEFCHRIARFHIRWECAMTAVQIDPKILRMMKESGCCSIALGVESMSPRVLASMMKPATQEEIERAVAMIHEAGIALWANLIFGDPAETIETVTETTEWFSNHPQYNLRFADVGYHPGSKIYEEARQKGLIRNPITFLLSGESSINGTSMSDEDHIKSKVLANRAAVSFGHAGKLLDLTRRPDGRVVARCRCPYCGAGGFNHTLDGNPYEIACINCPECNRGYRVPISQRLDASRELAAPLATLQRMLSSGATIPSIESSCNKILSIDPQNTYVWNLLTHMAKISASDETVARVLEFAIMADPYNPLLFEEMAARLENLGLFEARKKYVLKATHLRTMGISGTVYVNVILPEEERIIFLRKQIELLNMGMPVASFLIGQKLPGDRNDPAGSQDGRKPSSTPSPNRIKLGDLIRRPLDKGEKDPHRKSVMHT